MPRRPTFSFATFDVHLQPSMRRAFLLADVVPATFERSLADRLQALKRIFDDEANAGQAAAR